MAKLAFITIDEVHGTEKRTVTQVLVQASDFRNALDTLLDGMKGTAADYEIVSIAETLLMDVYKAKLGEFDAKKAE